MQIRKTQDKMNKVYKVRDEMQKVNQSRQRTAQITTKPPKESNAQARILEIFLIKLFAW